MNPRALAALAVTAALGAGSALAASGCGEKRTSGTGTGHGLTSPTSPTSPSTSTTPTTGS